MQHTIEKLNSELDSVLTFWLNNSISDKVDIIGEMSINNIPNPAAVKGSMFLARIIYGASAACRHLKTDKYNVLADLAFKILTQDFKNPKGGYVWAKNCENSPIHDSENTNMAQAFILYGLAEYVLLTDDSAAINEMEKQLAFILKTFKDAKNGGYFDDYDENWQALPNQTKALGTHLHLLEAFAKVYEFNQNPSLLPLIEELIKLILTKFITSDTLDGLHRLSPDWKPLENFIWAGHNAECSWILCKTAKLTGNKDLILECDALAIKVVENVIHQSLDKTNGGIFNAMKNGLPAEEGKIWWVQAESVTALLNCYQITNDDRYKKIAFELMNYISTKFIDESGEWYTELTKTGEPNLSIPKIHFWKSLYHNVRYYVEATERLKAITL
jgi:mannobiose 2-epimerase